jgi:hypothetical protein
MNFSTCFYSDQQGLRLDNKTSCADGFYCPFISSNNTESFPVFCQMSLECAYRRIQGLQCIDGYNGAQGLFEPTICLAGQYCPSPRYTFKCPEKHFCPSGTVTPHKCDLFSSCPPGTVTQRFEWFDKGVLMEFFYAYFWILFSLFYGKSKNQGKRILEKTGATYPLNKQN